MPEEAPEEEVEDADGFEPVEPEGPLEEELLLDTRLETGTDDLFDPVEAEADLYEAATDKDLSFLNIPLPPGDPVAEARARSDLLGDILAEDEPFRTLRPV